MAAQTILFLGGAIHHSNSLTTLTPSASSGGHTDSGYHSENLRDSNLLTAWKGPDSTTTDYRIDVDLGAFVVSGISPIGNDGETAYWAMAYDARNNQQDTIYLQYDTADNPAFTSVANTTSFSPAKSGSAVGFFYGSFTIPSIAGNPPRYWRISVPGAERSETTGTKPTKIYYFELFDKDDVLLIGTSPYASDAVGAHELTPFTRIGEARTAVGSIASNRYASYGVRFQTTFQPATKTLWEAVRDKLTALNSPGRAFFVQHEGIRTEHGTSNFSLCRPVGNELRGQKSHIDLIESGITWETEPWL